jgi:phosphatidylinositol N-acetylglucosaminyltransferase subunit Q
VPYLPALIYFIGFSSFAGASMPIAIFSDLLSLLTLHIYSFYIASARIFNWQLTIIYSLFQLFRGKKRNMLRNRIDNCDYDLDQLLLGTILFTLLFFLLPTVAVFYLTFATARMAIISLKAVLDTCLACLNHFPLFALMLRLKDSRRLPGGIRFRLIGPHLVPTLPPSAPRMPGHPSSTAEHDQANVSYIDLSSTSLSLREIFAPYFHLGARVRKHYLSPKVVLRLITGRFVPPLGRSEMYGLQYSMLPPHRVSVGEVWKALTGTDPVKGATAQVWPSQTGRARTWGHNGSAVGKRWR